MPEKQDAHHLACVLNHDGTLEMHDMGECKPVYTVGVRPAPSMNQGEGNLLTKAGAQAVPAHRR